MSHGISLDFDGRRVALKWHRLRRRMSDPVFGSNNLREGMRLGASMEIDLRVTRDFDFAVLHDAALERETDGSGVVAERTCSQLASIRYDDRDLPGVAPDARPLLLLGDLTALLDGAHPEALLQFDMKDRLAAVQREGVERLKQAFAGKHVPLVISGACSDLILALSNELPQIRRGIDPTDRLVDLFRKADIRTALQEFRSEIRGPAQPEIVYLSWQLLLHTLHAGVDLVAICHDEGKCVDAWTFTLSDPEAGFNDGEWRDLSRLLSLGVDQITTDEAVATERAYVTRIRSG